MSSFRSHRYGVRTEWRDGRRVSLEAPGKPRLDVALPSDSENGLPGVWTPEELLTASLGTCFELAMIAVAEDRGLPLHSLRVDATGYVERTTHVYRLALLDLHVHVDTDVGREPDVEHIAAVAYEECLVRNALDVPVRLEVSTTCGTKETVAGTAR